jgi:hypothetical protein
MGAIVGISGCGPAPLPPIVGPGNGLLLIGLLIGAVLYLGWRYCIGQRRTMDGLETRISRLERELRAIKSENDKGVSDEK